ncbi:peptidase MA family metallohydrolase [Nitrospinota bacterium]
MTNAKLKYRAAWALMALMMAGASAGGVVGSVSGQPAHGGKERPDGYRQVVGELRAWDLEAADRLLSELRRNSPALPEWDALEGAMAFLRGNYAESIDRLNEALRKAPGDSEWLELRLHVKQSQSAIQGFKVHRTKNFEIRYDPEADLILLPYLSETLEAAHRVFGKELGVKLNRRVRVEVFSDPDRFHKASTIRRRDIEKGVVGLTKFNKVLIISPGALQRGYRWLDTAAHEFIHFLITTETRNKTPIWLHEGIAKFLEKKWRLRILPPLNPVDEALLARAREKDSFIPFKSMEPSLIYLKTAEDVQLAYAEGASVVDFILRRGGKNALKKMLRAIRDSAPLKKVSPPAGGASIHMGRASLVELESTGPPQSAAPGLRSLFGVGLAEFETLWKKDLKRQSLRALSGARVRKFRLKATGPIDKSGADLAALKSAVARRRTRLADRLWLRGRLKAAWVEYKRALRDEPDSPPLLNRLARVEIHLGMPQQALRNLGKAVEVDPDYGASYVHRGIAFEMRGDEKSSRKAWEEAIHINPFDPVPHERLALFYEKEGLGKEAKRELEVARQLRRN